MGQSSEDCFTVFFVSFVLLCLFCIFLICLFFYMTKFLSGGFLLVQKWQWATSSFCLFLYILVSISFLQNTQRAPDTRWGSIDGHRGVLQIFCVFFF